MGLLETPLSFSLSLQACSVSEDSLWGDVAGCVRCASFSFAEQQQIMCLSNNDTRGCKSAEVGKKPMAHVLYIHPSSFSGAYWFYPGILILENIECLCVAV